MTDPKMEIATRPLGVAKGKVVLSSATPEWAKAFEAEAKKVTAAFEAAKLPARMLHIGSTAFGDIVAKPIIDTLILVDTPKALRPAFEVAATLKWVRLASFEGGSDFLFADGDPRKFHYHLTYRGSVFDRNTRLLMSGLRHSKTIRVEYEAVKIEMAAKYPDDRKKYTDSKRSFLHRVAFRSLVRREAARVRSFRRVRADKG